jgi:FAD dependent oxidoreductase TIGR03364
MRNGHPDLIVVGAGVLGAFHAYFAALRGLRVLLLDRDSRPTGASTRSVGVLARAMADASGPWSERAEQSRAIYRALHAEGDISLRTGDSLFLAESETQSRVLAEFAADERWAGACSLLSAAEAQARFDCLREGSCLSALLFADDLSVDPRVMLPRLLERWIVAGLLRYRPGTNVVSVRAGGLHVTVHSADGATFLAERVLICSGADTRTLFPGRLRASGLQLAKFQLLRIAPFPTGMLPCSVFGGSALRTSLAFRSCPSFPQLQRDAAGRAIPLTLRQYDDGSIAVGQSVEQFGLDEMGAFEERMRPELNAALLDAARRAVCLPAWPVAEAWNSYALVHPELPVVSAAFDGRIQLLTGLGANGMVVAPGFAQANIQAWY